MPPLHISGHTGECMTAMEGEKLTPSPSIRTHWYGAIPSAESHELEPFNTVVKLVLTDSSESSLIMAHRSTLPSYIHSAAVSRLDLTRIGNRQNDLVPVTFFHILSP